MGEECDGNNLNGETCRTLGYDSGTLTRNSNCTFNESQCVVSTCGNDTVESGEECDGKNLAGETCQFLGFDSGRLQCNSNCTFNKSQCRSEEEGGKCKVQKPRVLGGDIGYHLHEEYHCKCFNLGITKIWGGNVLSRKNL